MSWIDEIDMDRLRALWGQNLTAASIGAELGISAEQVRTAAAAEGLRRGRRMISVPRHEFARLWADGAPVGEIAARYGVSSAYVSQLAQRWHLPPRGPGRKPQPRPQTPLPPETRPAARKTRAQAHPNWPAAIDECLRRCGGTYRELSDLAALTGRSATALRARWHILRGGS